MLFCWPCRAWWLRSLQEDSATASTINWHCSLRLTTTSGRLQKSCRERVRRRGHPGAAVPTPARLTAIWSKWVPGWVQPWLAERPSLFVNVSSRRAKQTSPSVFGHTTSRFLLDQWFRPCDRAVSKTPFLQLLHVDVHRSPYRPVPSRIRGRAVCARRENGSRC